MRQPWATSTAGEGLPWPAGGLVLGSQWEVSEGFWEGMVAFGYLPVCSTLMRVEDSLGGKVSGSQHGNRLKEAINGLHSMGSALKQVL